MRTSFLMAVIYTALAVSSQATLIAHWDLDEASSLYANTVPAGPLLTQDVATDAAGTGAGILGNAARLQFAVGPSTRLSSASDPQAVNTFAFSMFVNPVFVSAGDTFLAAEATGGSITTRTFDYWNWAVRAVTVGGGLGWEFIVRGQGGLGNEGFASQVTGQLLPSGGGQEGHWWHLAGGYDAATGAIGFYVRDMTDDPSATAFAGIGDSGMTTHGAGLALGTVDYNGSYVNFAADTSVDEVSLFDAMLTPQDVANLEVVPEPTTTLLLGVGALAIAWKARHRARA